MEGIGGAGSGGVFESEARASRLAALAAVLVDGDEAILQATTEEQVYETLCRVVLSRLGLPLVWVGLTEPGRRLLRIQASGGEEAGYLDEGIFRKGGVVPVGGIISRTLRDGRAHAIDDLVAPSATRRHGCWPSSGASGVQPHFRSRQAALSSGRCSAHPASRDISASRRWCCLAG